MEEKDEKPKMKRLNVELTPDEHAEFKAYAARRRMTMKELVETWIRDVVKGTPEAGSKGGMRAALIAEVGPGYQAG